MRWLGLALLGILVAAAVAFAASRLASQQIGLASEPVSAGDALVPRATGHPTGHRSGTPGSAGPSEPRTEPESQPEPAPEATPAPGPSPQAGPDDSGSEPAAGADD